MNNCKKCGKPISDSLNICSECAQKIKAEGEKARRQLSKAKIQVTIGKTTGLILGSGALARTKNIAFVKSLLEQGCTREQIADALEPYFKPATVEEYLRVAEKLLEREQKEAEET